MINTLETLMLTRLLQKGLNLGELQLLSSILHKSTTNEGTDQINAYPV
jgi:hypothetical protein